MNYLETIPEIEKEEFTSQAYENHQNILKCTEIINKGYIALSKLLQEHKNRKYYLIQNESWDEYLGEIKIEASRARRLLQANRLMLEIQERTGTEPDFSDISESRLTRDIIPIIKRKNGKIQNFKEVLEILDDAKELSRTDLMIKISQTKQDITERKRIVVKVDIGSLIDIADSYIGEVYESSADEKYHYLKLKIRNDAFNTGSPVFALPMRKGKDSVNEILNIQNS